MPEKLGRRLRRVVGDAGGSAGAAADIAILRKQRAKEECAAKLKDMFIELDASGDGRVSWDEFQILFTDDDMKTWC